MDLRVIHGIKNGIGHLWSTIGYGKIGILEL